MRMELKGERSGVGRRLEGRVAKGTEQDHKGFEVISFI